jgi:hypothetical protein
MLTATKEQAMQDEKKILDTETTKVLDLYTQFIKECQEAEKERLLKKVLKSS